MNKKLLSLACMAIVMLLTMAAPAWAKIDNEAPGSFRGPGIAIGLGAGITLIGAGWGFGRIGAAALESMARQPEVQGRIFTTMLLIAALLEGATFFSLIVCLLIMIF
jgi:F-type H+-transporting ATPase subunit c